MWCRSAVSFSPGFLATASRMRACACDTASRRRVGDARFQHDVRTVLCWLAFLSAPALGSIRSAASGLDPDALFVDFTATTAGSDFSRSCIIGYDLIGLPDADRRQRAGGQTRDLPVPMRRSETRAFGTTSVIRAWGL